MRWASALSLEQDVDAALDETARQLKAGLGARPDVAFVFVSPQHRTEFGDVLTGVHKRLAPRFLTGCSGVGIVGAAQEAENVPALSVTAALLPNVTFQPLQFQDAALPGPDDPPRAWLQASGVKADANPHFILFADPYSIRADDLLAGLDFAFQDAVKIGGLASGAHGPGQNALYLQDRVYREGAVGLAVMGDLRIDTLVTQGCRPIGKPMAVTKCHRNILIELDKRRALDVLGELLESCSERDRQLVRTSLFLGLSVDPFKAGEPQAGDFLVRNLIGMDAQRGALAVRAMLREGQTVQFHLCDAAAASEELSNALRRYSTDYLDAANGESLPPPPRGALLFTCAGRGAHLYGRPNHDSQLFQTHLGEVPLGGFFANGEIGPVGGATHIHTFTSCFAIFRTKSQ